MIFDDDDARREELADLRDEARAYRTALRRRINASVIWGRKIRSATFRERFLRASYIALHECPRLFEPGLFKPGLFEDKGWTIEEYIKQLVAYRYPGIGGMD